jgi:hypothetical protein
MNPFVARALALFSSKTSETHMPLTLKFYLHIVSESIYSCLRTLFDTSSNWYHILIVLFQALPGPLTIELEAVS